jgi:Flp pilus assembly protein TadB
MTRQQAARTTEPSSQHAQPELRPGWQRVSHADIPAPTYWPAVLAFGITLIFWGIVTSWIISGVGVIVFAVAIAGWIGDLLHGH